MRTFLFVLFTCFPFIGLSQDIIVSKDGKTIKAKVMEITQSEIKYKRFDNIDGPLISISKDGILIINYQNGTKETFGRNEIMQTSNTAAVTSSNTKNVRLESELNLGDVVIFRGDNGRFRTGRLLSINNDSAIVRSRYKTISLPINAVSKKID